MGVTLRRGDTSGDTSGDEAYMYKYVSGYVCRYVGRRMYARPFIRVNALEDTHQLIQQLICVHTTSRYVRRYQLIHMNTSGDTSVGT